MSELIKFVENALKEEITASKKENNVPEFSPGDTISVHLKIKGKERVQQFQGTVMQRRHAGGNGETFTVRKISNGIGVERIFPVLSPNIERIVVVRKGNVRRARLYYLRGLQGKAARIKEKISFKRK